MAASSSNATMAGKFISATAIEAARQEREAEGKVEEKEVYDPRPLFERLAERKRIEEEEFAEKMRFSNLVKRLDEDEFEFLARYQDDEAKKRNEIAANDRQELEAFRKAVAEANPVQVVPAAPMPPEKKPIPFKDLQKALLQQGIVRKRKSDHSADRETEHARERPKKIRASATEKSTKESGIGITEVEGNGESGLSHLLSYCSENENEST